MTDEASVYAGIGWNFTEPATVNSRVHEYVRGDVYGNTAEGYFLILTWWPTLPLGLPDLQSLHHVGLRVVLYRLGRWFPSPYTDDTLAPMSAAHIPIRVNRAPVLTLWATVVAEWLGYPPETALTLGRFVAGSSARAKARRLGINEETQEAGERHARAAELQPRRQTVRRLGLDIPVLEADDGTLRAEDDGKWAGGRLDKVERIAI